MSKAIMLISYKRYNKVKRQIENMIQYNTNFVSMIKKGEADLAAGSGIKMNICNLCK